MKDFGFVERDGDFMLDSISIIFDTEEGKYLTSWTITNKADCKKAIRRHVCNECGAIIKPKDFYIFIYLTYHHSERSAPNDEHYRLCELCASGENMPPKVVAAMHTLRVRKAGGETKKNK